MKRRSETELIISTDSVSFAIALSLSHCLSLKADGLRTEIVRKIMTSLVLSIARNVYSTIVIIVILSSLLGRVSCKCPHKCSGNGKCVLSASGRGEICECYEGYFGHDCAMRDCPYGPAWVDIAIDEDVAHRLARCSNMGHCDFASGDCTCEPGFEGPACERLGCPVDDVGITCSGHGVCLSMAQFAQIPRYDSSYENRWDSNRVYGCLCERGFEAQYDCSVGPSCATGDDPLTTGQTNEIQYIECDLKNDETRKTKFRICWQGQCTGAIQWDDTEDVVRDKINAIKDFASMSMDGDAIDITFLENHTTVCAGMYNDDTEDLDAPQLIRVEFRKLFGDLAPLEFHDIPNADGTSSYPAVQVACDTDNAWKQSICASTTFMTTAGEVLFPVRGSKEEAVCANRGYCEEGTCICDARFASSDGEGRSGLRGDCGFKVYELHTKKHADDPDVNLAYDCVGEIPCSGHGHCSGAPEFTCLCHSGWMGPDCAEMTCPKGKVWFGPPHDVDASHHTQEECSGRGVCDRATGECVCDLPFRGANCEIMRCPRGETGTLPCSGHGRCLLMSELAQTAGRSYGSEPNDPAVWDFDMVEGCFCNEGWGGIACDRRLCPRGDNPLTAGVSEIQRLTCGSQYLAHDGASPACFSGPMNDRLRLNLASIRGEFTNHTFGLVGHGACRDIDQLEPVSYSRVVGIVDYCSAMCEEIGDACEGYSFCTGLGWTPINASSTPQEQSCAGKCTLYSSVRPDTSDVWQLYEPQLPTGVESAGPIETVTPEETWWQCYTRDAAEATSTSENAIPILDIDLYYDRDASLEACAESSTCAAVAALYPHEYPISFNGLPIDGNSDVVTSNASYLYALLPTEAIEKSSYGETQKNRETYVKRTGDECVVRVGVQHKYADQFSGRYDGLRDFYDVGIFANDRHRYDGQYDPDSFANVEIKSNVVDAATTLRDAFERARLSTDGVDFLTQDETTSLCPYGTNLSTTNNSITFEFTHSLGNLAKLDVVTYVGVNVLVETIQNGSIENAECSGQGTCDYDTGVCTCFPGFKSSDGHGRQGNRHDCGYVSNDILSSSSEV